MTMMSVNWAAETLWEQLEPQCPGLTVEIAAELPSTNTTLLTRAKRAEKRDMSPCLLVAEHQTAGRGRLGRTWLSDAGSTLTFSLGLPLAPKSWDGLSLAVGVALAEALGPQIQLKWPNDLWVRQPQKRGGEPGEVESSKCFAKVGGILIETVPLPAEKSSRWVVVGVGLNVKQAPGASEGRDDNFSIPAAALSEHNPSIQDAGQALHRVAQPLLTALQHFERAGWAAFAARYALRDVLSGQAVTVSSAEGSLRHGVGNGISEKGGLRVIDPTGIENIVTSAEVSIRLC
jgi:BirA family biotin operon repressor/biotin-[acetyl-CoA-carboxylase] ligase